jgi:hypothetical protein
VISLESRASEEIVTVVEEDFASLLGQVSVIEIEPAEISDQFPVPSLVVCLVRPRQSQIQVRQSDRTFRIHEAVGAYNIEPQKSVTVFNTKFNTPFAGVSSRNFYLGSLASQVIRFNLELAIEPGQDPEKPVWVVKNNLRQRFSRCLPNERAVHVILTSNNFGFGV